MSTISQPTPLFAIQRTNTILYCVHWSATVAFYRDQLGLPMTHGADWFVEFQLGPTAYLSIADSARATIRPANGAGLTISWQVVDLGLIQQRLNGQGITTTAIKQKWGARVLYFHDPEGHRIELWA